MSRHRNDPVDDGQAGRPLLADRTLALDDAADLYGISVDTLRRWISSGKVTGYRFGPRRIRIQTDDLEAMFIPIGPGDL
ncbi:helix-turn-helix domain-containing protein [Dietzia maris]|uniref:helix-turn-helix domain-containing protein n=1 Tax=Dietzia maris TaxID=37915 RepID=UPI0034216AEA